MPLYRNASYGNATPPLPTSAYYRPLAPILSSTCTQATSPGVCPQVHPPAATQLWSSTTPTSSHRENHLSMAGHIGDQYPQVATHVERRSRLHPAAIARVMADTFGPNEEVEVCIKTNRWVAGIIVSALKLFDKACNAWGHEVQYYIHGIASSAARGYGDVGHSIDLSRIRRGRNTVL
ncbi:hypothetical protein CYLTODRAFT_464466 [Cylindrobasidium torrendii FP15055 ss-10]|uniref:Uncharacterized protein n=1 Tax=Cylindrobasidium torrendii FP15055 ss-10 TaxID=1314674 RepID=A0A0D7BP80_9AGAR|nr:hypothetical protein CYLTODRAFT_464466 [Cylindrobasidium torrendii FP15055 ss-10]